MPAASAATLIGTIGAIIILILFILNQSNKLKNNDFKYDLFNLIGSILLITYAVMLNSLPFIALNFIWGAVSLRDLILKALKAKKIRLTV